MVLAMAAQAQKTDETLEKLTTSITREVKGLFALERALKEYESQIPEKTNIILKEAYSLVDMNAQALAREAKVCESLLGCIERWHK